MVLRAWSEVVEASERGDVEYALTRAEGAALRQEGRAAAAPR
jgi:hypothetical protein